MKTKVILTIDANLTNRQRNALRVLFNDAFGEFVAARSPIAAYVDKRYADWGARRSEKVEQVMMRCQLAKLVHDAEMAIADAPEAHDGLGTVFEDEAFVCPACGGEPSPLGILGKRAHFRCRRCGGDFHREATPEDIEGSE